MATLEKEELSIKSLKKETKITDEQLDTRIEETDLPELAACFDNTDDYVEKLGLTPGQQTDVHDARTKAPSDGTKAGMKVALKYWRNKNPLLATFRSLLLIILPLLKGDVVLRVCNFVLSKYSGEVVRLKPSHGQPSEPVHAQANARKQEHSLPKNASSELNITSDSRKSRENSQPASAATADINTDYYDILVIGRTGLGKSSTVDKLMVPNRCTLSTTQPLLTTNHPSSNSGEVATANSTFVEEQDVQKIDVDETGEIKHGNLRARILSVEDEDYETAQKRLKNIAECRGENNPHEKINELRAIQNSQSVKDSTRHCELLTNTDSKIRVLDAPGFFNPQLTEGATNAIDSNLATVRHIIHIQAAEMLKIKRIVFFLPQNGPLTRADRILQEEIKTMVKFFGKFITNCMVLVGTMPEHVSVLTDWSSEQKFPEKLLNSSGRLFQEAYQRELTEQQEASEELRAPPIIFIAMTDTCEEIFEKINSAPVNDNNYLLDFNSKTCCKCGIDLHPLKAQQGSKDWVTKRYLDDDLLCHPEIQPMYSANSMARGVLKLFRFKWEFTKERCIHCRAKIGSDNQRGCLRVNKPFKLRSKWWRRSLRTIVVEHSSSVV